MNEKIVAIKCVNRGNLFSNKTQFKRYTNKDDTRGSKCIHVSMISSIRVILFLSNWTMQKKQRYFYMLQSKWMVEKWGKHSTSKTRIASLEII